MIWNYGLAIILLTVLVRGCMFPLSRKQAAGAQKMQQLQPEIKKIQEKYKKNIEGRSKAQQELFRKHNYNPLSGCLVLFIQMPIFIGLYRSLMVDVELRDAPLLSSAVRWCSNLAAPDMLFNWSRSCRPGSTAAWACSRSGHTSTSCRMLTIVLMLRQQKMFMPPPADEQAAMQQKMMKYMMIFMGLMFFKVASGLCIYFIASSLWGLAERKFLPKNRPPAAASVASEARRSRRPAATTTVARKPRRRRRLERRWPPGARRGSRVGGHHVSPGRHHCRHCLAAGRRGPRDHPLKRARGHRVPRPALSTR